TGAARTCRRSASYVGVSTVASASIWSHSVWESIVSPSRRMIRACRSSRQMVEVLAGRDLDGDGGRVPTAARVRTRGEPGRRRRRRAWALFRRRAEQRALALREQFLQEGEFVLCGHGRVAAQTREFGGQRLELGVEGVVLALEEDRDLTEHLRIADRIEAEHPRTTSSSPHASNIFLLGADDERRGRERDAP